MALCGALVLAFSVEAYASETKTETYLCPAIPSGSGSNERCLCSTTNWSNETRVVTTELLDEDGNTLKEEGVPLGAVTVVLGPEESTRVRATGPFSTDLCTCRVTIDTKKARVSITRRRVPGTVQFIGIANCSRRD